jgi:hypothetical protein
LKQVTGSKIGISQESTLICNATDKNGIIAPAGVAFTSNDTPRIEPYLSSSMTIGPGLAVEGAYQYSFEGKDASGNYATRDIEVIIDTTKPTPSLSFSKANPQDLRGWRRWCLEPATPTYTACSCRLATGRA